MEENEERCFKFAFEKVAVWDQINNVIDVRIVKIMLDRELEGRKRSPFYKLSRFFQRLKRVLREELEDYEDKIDKGW